MVSLFHRAKNMTVLDFLHILTCRFTLPPFLALKNFEGINLGKMDKVNDILSVISLSLSLSIYFTCLFI